MTKLKEPAVENYSKAYARKTVAEFFSTYEAISGKQILSFSEISQVNMFVLQHLFANWQEETARLQSPYFDYQSREVREALTQFMNTVSQYISVKREHFEPLVMYAVKSTLQLLLAPQEFVTQLLHKTGTAVTINQLRETGKYIQLNKSLFSAFLLKLEALFTDKIPVDKAEEIWTQVYDEKKEEAENAELYLEMFSRKVPLYKEDFFNKQIPVQNPQVAPLIDNLHVDIEQFVKAANNKSPLSITQPLISVPPEQTKLTNEQLKAASLYEKFIKEQSTLNDRLKQETRSTLLDKHQKTKIKDIKSAISLNQRFSFTNVLFKGDNTLFNQALQELDQCVDYQSASYLLKQKYATQYNWDIQSEEAQAFFEVVERKFY